MPGAFSKPGKWITLILTVLLIGWLVYTFTDIFIILAVAFLLSFIFDPFVIYLEKLHIGRTFSTVIVFVFFIALFYLAFSILIPQIAEEMAELSHNLKLDKIEGQLQEIEESLRGSLPFLEKGIIMDSIETFLKKMFSESPGQITGLIGNIVSAALFAVLIPFATFFMVKDRNKLIKSIVSLFPNKYFETSYWIVKKITVQMGKFVRAWIVDAAYTGVGIGIGFAIIGLDNSIALGVIAGVGNLIPYLGPFIAGVPAVLVSLVQYGDFSGIPLIVLVILIVYLIDNFFIQPYIYSRSVNIHPLMIAMLIIAGGTLYGVMGMFFAVPAAAIFLTAAREITFALKNYSIARSPG